MEEIQRDMNFQTVGWFWDLYKRELLIMDPPYQRRSVWTQEYKDYFVDTVLHGYPAPALFLFRETTPDGISQYSVVDGKQRLSALFDFASNLFPISQNSTVAKTTRFRGSYFKDLPNEIKTSFWNYRFAVENLPSSNEEIINNIFDRINRNVSKLTPQELRHARYNGEFISEIQKLSAWMFKKLPPGVPNISSQSRKQMKDDEFVAQLLLLIETGPKKDSQDDLDEAFALREQSWESKDSTVTRFQDIIEYLAQLSKTERGATVLKSRLRNQADFFSLFGAINEIMQIDGIAQIQDPISSLENFVKVVDDPEKRANVKVAKEYFDAVRFSSNDTGPRRFRINIIQGVLLGKTVY